VTKHYTVIPQDEFIKPLIFQSEYVQPKREEHSNCWPFGSL